MNKEIKQLLLDFGFCESKIDTSIDYLPCRILSPSLHPKICLDTCETTSIKIISNDKNQLLLLTTINQVIDTSQIYHLTFDSKIMEISIEKTIDVDLINLLYVETIMESETFITCETMAYLFQINVIREYPVDYTSKYNSIIKTPFPSRIEGLNGEFVMNTTLPLFFYRTNRF